MSSSTQVYTWPALVQVCVTAAKQAEHEKTPCIASFTVEQAIADPFDVYSITSFGSPRMFWSNPGGSLTLIGLGSAWNVTGTGSDRFGDAASGRRWLAEHCVTNVPSPARGIGPVLLGGFAFNPTSQAKSSWHDFPDGLLNLPKVLATITPEGMWVTVNQVYTPGDDCDSLVASMQECLGHLIQAITGTHRPDPSSRHNGGGSIQLEAVQPEAWKASVAKSAARVREGAMEKVVLARTVKAQAPVAIDPLAILVYLKNTYPNYYLFAIEQGESHFVGATPEQLVCVDAGTVHAMCLAGSTARGDSPAEDSALGAALMASAKDRREHEIVVRALTSNLMRVCNDVTTTSEPDLLRLPNVQHLHTPVTARLMPDCTVLEVVEQLHPTPAVGGYPRQAALMEIARREPVERGWYAGPVGWVNTTGDGEFAVAIRSALVKGSTAILYAGCGILADSDPTSEYEESCLKLRPMLSALEATLS